MTAKSNAMSAVLRTAAHRAIAAHEAVGNIAKQTPDDTEPFHIALDARNDAIVALGRTVLNILLAGGEVDCSLDAAQNGTPVIATSRMALAAEPGDPAIVMQTPAAPATVVRRKRGASPSRRRVVAPSAARASLQPASSDQLERLSGSGLGPNWSETSADNNPEAWKAAVDLFGPPPEVSDIISYDKALRRLVRGVQVDDWRSYPRDLQKSLVGYASSLSRFLQDEAGPAIGLSHPPHELSTMFSVMTRYSDVERPGFVSGLSRRNPPEYGTWALDCDWWWTRLQRLIGEDDESEPSAVDKTKAWAQLTEVLTEGSESEALLNALRSLRMAGVSSDDKRLLDVMFPHAHLLEGVTAFKTLRKKLLRMADVEEDVVEAEDHTSPVPEDWPLWDRTRGKDAAVLGGDPRPRALARLKGAFDFAELTWEVADSRRTQALAERVRSQGVDMVIVLRRFVSHKLTDVLLPACRSADVPFVVVDTGYGVNQTRLALERYLT